MVSMVTALVLTSKGPRSHVQIPRDISDECLSHGIVLLIDGGRLHSGLVTNLSLGMLITVV